MLTTHQVNNAAPPSSPQPEVDGLASGIRRIFDALRRHWMVLATIVVATMLVVLIALMAIPPKYEATARLRVQPTQNVLVGETPAGSNLPDQSIVETEASVMRSHDLVADVVRKLDLSRDPEFAKQLKPLPASPSAQQIEQRIDEVASAMSRAVDVSREKATYVVDLSFRSADPDKSASIANALARTYLEESTARRVGTASMQSGLLQKRLVPLAQQAQQADERLAQYRAATGTVGEGESSITDQQITPLAGQLATAESEAAALRAKVAAARTQVRSGGIDAVSAVLGSNVISNLRAQRATLGTQYGEISTRYGPKHPESLRIHEQLTAIDRQIKEEADRVIGSLQSEASAATARASSLRSDLVRLRGQQSVETRSTVAADSLKRAADAAHLAYNQAAAVAQRTSEIVASPLSQAQMIEAATVPDEPSAPNKKLLLAAGLAFALALGASTVGMLELLSSGLRTRRDLEALGLPLLAAVPLMGQARVGRRLRRGEPSPADSIIEAPFTAYAETFRSIRNTVTISNERPIQVLALTSSLPGEGKTTTSLSLARIMAMSDERTLLIDADTRRAGLRALVRASREVGLVEVLNGTADFAQAVQRDVVDNLDLLLVTGSTFVQSNLLSSERLTALVASLRGRYDRIIFDTPPLLGVSEARAVAAVADAVIMVVQWSRTPSNALRSAIDLLQQDHARTIGAVFTMVDPKAKIADGFDYADRYSAYYQKAP